MCGNRDSTDRQPVPVVGIALLGRSRAGLKTKLPFGAFLSLGGLFALFAGTPLVDLYLRLL